jgi:23S rRNA pseudouridine1911/1915/1917 synthase
MAHKRDTGHGPLRVLYEDNHLLAVIKPPGLSTMGAAEGKISLLDLARRYVKQKYQKPGNVYLGVVSRLDALATGVVLLARTSKAAQRLSKQFRERDVEKTYWAIVAGRISPQSGSCVDWVRKDEQRRRMRIASPGAAGTKRAELQYRVLRPIAGGSLLEINLVTGRKHQIRLQLAHRGHPIWGDRKYGSTTKFPEGIALLARRLVLIHPVRKEPLELVAPVPRSWREHGVPVDWAT